MKYSVVTFGCRVNQADSLGFEEELLAGGAVPASTEDADLVIVNTCSVTASADQGARQTIRRVARQNPGARIVVTGCYATRAAEDVGGLSDRVEVIPNDDKPQLISLVRGVRLVAPSFRSGASPASPGIPPVGPSFSSRASLHSGASPDLTSADRFGGGEGSCGATIEPGVAGRTAFTLRVQTGCAELCSYCIIPTTRGTPRSVPVASVLSEVDRVVSAGFKEIALTGVHLGSYGRDLAPRSSLIDLLTALASGRDRVSGPSSFETQDPPGGEVMFRISSLEPNDCTSEVVDAVARNVCFAPHFHLPLQHASDRVLAAMRRPYTIDYYAALVDDIRGRMPDAAIGSDVIVGFPGETDEDFDQLASYLESSPLTHLHVFPYSDRPGTSASAMRGKVPGLVVRERGRRVRELSAALAKRFLDSQVGTVHRALTLEDGSLAVTGNYLKVRIPPGRVRNEWIDVRITSANPLAGETTL